MPDQTHLCDGCGLERVELLQESGFGVGDRFACGSTVRYNIEVTEKMQVVRVSVSRETRTVGCLTIAAMRPVVEAALAHVAKPTDLHTGVVLIDEVAKYREATNG